ncbi:MAG: serine/threonine-protein kinase [Planctomycetota bacterium]
MTDQTPKPPSDSDSSGTFARAVENNQAIPGYEVVRKLGSGAMAAVFLARQVSLDRLVAIKILPSRFSANKDYIKRFQQEGKAAAKLNHPNIVAAVDVGAVGRRHYFVMEYVDGTDVHELLKKESKLSERRALEIIQEIALALQHAHGKGFLHRDIKPRNIMITKAGVAKLADLGLARHVDDTETAEAEKNKAFGTPFYISPEQIRGKMDIAAPADIYGLGATFYHMVTGKVPFTGANPKEVMKAHLKEELVPPDHLNSELSSGCAQIIEHMLARRVEDRYHSADDLLIDLELVMQGLPPKFARSSLDASVLAETAAAAAAATAIPTQVAKPTVASAPPTWMIAALVGSMFMNLLLFILYLLK